MQISHESPLCLLEESRKFNDYDYALVHLFEENLQYLQFFRDSISQGRRVILDNSIFELGKSFEPKRFRYWVEELRPTEYIIPDVLEDYQETKQSLENWIHENRDLSGVKIGVVQGKTYSELIDCYKIVDSHCDKIAISFDYSFYTSLFPYVSKHVGFTLGRSFLIHSLLRDGVINTKKPHHLLGCPLPWEFTLYRNLDWIETVDTSSPIVHSILGVEFGELGIHEKKTIKLVDLLFTQKDSINLDLLYHNIKTFRYLCQ